MSFKHLSNRYLCSYYIHLYSLLSLSGLSIRKRFVNLLGCAQNSIQLAGIVVQRLWWLARKLGSKSLFIASCKYNPVRLGLITDTLFAVLGLAQLWRIIITPLNLDACCAARLVWEKEEWGLTQHVLSRFPQDLRCNISAVIGCREDVLLEHTSVWIIY